MGQDAVLLTSYTFDARHGPYLAVPVALTNTTDEEVVYAEHGETFYGFQIRLATGGEFLSTFSAGPDVPPGADDVRHLEPGSSAVRPLNLTRWYYEIRQTDDVFRLVFPAGTYTLWARYNPAPREDVPVTRLQVPLRPVAVIVVREDVILHERPLEAE